MSTKENSGQNAAKTAINPFQGEFDFETFIAENNTDLLQYAVRVPGRKNQVIVKVGSPADMVILPLSTTGESTALQDIGFGGEMYRLFMVSDALYAAAKNYKS